jgi:mRNA interferase HigB
MRVIKPGRIREFIAAQATAKSSLEGWLKVTQEASWASFPALRETYRSADLVTVASGRSVVVFNISGNQYRLITAIHFNTGKVFVLKFLSHAEYSKDRWKDDL